MVRTWGCRSIRLLSVRQEHVATPPLFPSQKGEAKETMFPIGYVKDKHVWAPARQC